jgi:hypothetical protein
MLLLYGGVEGFDCCYGHDGAVDEGGCCTILLAVGGEKGCKGLGEGLVDEEDGNCGEDDEGQGVGRGECEGKAVVVVRWWRSILEVIEDG